MSLDTLASLRAQGAHLHDPVRFRFLEAMAERMQTQPAAVQQVLARRFDEAVTAYRERVAQAPAAPVPKMPLHTAAGAKTSPLARLNRHIAAQARDAAGDAMPLDTGSPSDMKSVRRFAEVWSRMATEQQLAQALTRGPELAGPLNSHNLMLRAMSLMNGLSPDYLRRFLAEAEALLWLDHMNQQHALKDGKAARRGRGKK